MASEETPLVAEEQSRILSRLKLLWGSSRPPPPDIRRVYTNDYEENRRFQYESNETKTTKYTVWNFLFKNLFEQFRRASNFYFLIVILIQLIPTVSPIFPITSILPLAFVLFITATREGYEDYKRSVADKEVNQRLTTIVFEGQLVEKLYQDVEVGDILYIQKNQEIAADAILLSSSNTNGICFIETSNLDGESNLKLRTSPKLTSDFCSHERISQIKVYLECEKPNIHLYDFQASMHMCTQRDEFSTTANALGVNADQLLLRGSSLRNTNFAYALVVYTGPETKIILNQQEVPSKFSHVEKQLNQTLIWILYAQTILSALSALAAMYWRLSNIDDAGYLEKSVGSAWEEFQQTILDFLTFFVLLNYMIPISLYVTAEMCKVIMSYLMSCDLDMYHASSNETAIIKTSNLLDELGQIQYIFSDKTGTLTENIMTFRKCSIRGDRFYLPEQEKLEAVSKNVDSFQNMLEVRDWSQNNSYMKFWLTIGLCHTVNVDIEDGKIVYQASSSDEEALVYAAAHAGFILKNRTPEYIEIEHKGQILRYFIKEICHFDSTRKRMSILVKDSEGRYFVLVKGADSSILRILSQECRSQHSIIQKMKAHSDEFSTEGLRILCVAYAEISETDAIAWLKEMEKARCSMENREQKLIRAYSIIERNLELLGVTAIEDRLQEYVPETISQLSQANIKLWVLTGDKQETAINIGHSCNILKRDGITYITKGNNPEEVQKRLEKLQKFMDENGYTDRDTSIENTFSFENCWTSLRYIFGGNANTSQVIRGDEPISMKTPPGSEHSKLAESRRALLSDELNSSGNDYIAALPSPERIQLSESGLPHTSKKRATLGSVPSSLNDGYVSFEDEPPRVMSLGMTKSGSNIRLGDSTIIDLGLQANTSCMLQSIHKLPEIGLVIDGETITFALEHHKELFLSVAQKCHSVVCCRMSPLQKALVVRVVQESTKQPICLAIGDGGNDVSMIQEAKVGVGIIGREGRQAVRASDYSIAQFSFLRKLLFVHGRWCYRRMSVLIQYSYYKNMAFILPTVYYGFCSAFTGQTIIDPYVMMFYNIFYTSLPIFLLAVFEQDLPKHILLAMPELYVWIQSRADFCPRTFMGWMLFGIWHSVVIFASTYFSFGGDMFLPDGKSSGIWTMGTFMVSVCIFTVTWKVALITKFWSRFQFGAIFLSLLAFFLFLVIQSYFKDLDPANMYGVVQILFLSPTYWLGLLVFPIAAVLPDYIWKCASIEYRPSQTQIIKEQLRCTSIN